MIGARLKQTNVKHLGGGVHEGTATYHQTAPEVVQTIRYRTTGQTARIVQGYGTVCPPLDQMPTICNVKITPQNPTKLNLVDSDLPVRKRHREHFEL